ncbi:MAG: saccharopine dehydrogenase NADP-binding domain-containing protein [Xanthomonadales bacterium]|nr:saccharopine dehydrogenase NADP-binding domain-containing protein [Xanthomonadales bacterium]MCB1634059.1 saccharopine dehydrogenase NADP-binding domain-containing protein [Xanthomonadales bacterium]
MSQFKPSWLLYGATGYSGELIATEAAKRGHAVILGGRNPDRLQALADRLQRPQRCFTLDDRASVEKGLMGVRLVLNCAGPFNLTANALAQSCLRLGVHYLDISSEVADFRSLHRLDARARDNGVLLLPGVGTGVLPTDALALHLKQRVPSAVTLSLAMASPGAKLSRGSLHTLVESLRSQAYVREGDQLRPAEVKLESREVDFGPGGKHKVTSFPWRGDLYSAAISTGLQFISCYIAVPGMLQMAMNHRRWLSHPLLGRWVDRYVARASLGPDAKERSRSRTWFWGEVVNDIGTRASSVLSGPDGYELTKLTALYAVERVLCGDSAEGWCTPSQVFGTDPLKSLPGVTLTDR